jgi:hypothetical protein
VLRRSPPHSMYNALVQAWLDSMLEIRKPFSSVFCNGLLKMGTVHTHYTHESARGTMGM